EFFLFLHRPFRQFHPCPPLPHHRVQGAKAATRSVGRSVNLKSGAAKFMLWQTTIVSLIIHNVFRLSRYTFPASVNKRPVLSRPPHFMLA
ncbi:MAG: hypothetical protein ACI33O_04210, partial [Bhargavaea sp.]